MSRPPTTPRTPRAKVGGGTAESGAILLGNGVVSAALANQTLVLRWQSNSKLRAPLAPGPGYSTNLFKVMAAQCRVRYQETAANTQRLPHFSHVVPVVDERFGRTPYAALCTVTSLTLPSLTPLQKGTSAASDTSPAAKFVVIDVVDTALLMGRPGSEPCVLSPESALMCRLYLSMNDAMLPPDSGAAPTKSSSNNSSATLVVGPKQLQGVVAKIVSSPNSENDPSFELHLAFAFDVAIVVATRKFLGSNLTHAIASSDADSSRSPPVHSVYSWCWGWVPDPLTCFNVVSVVPHRNHCPPSSAMGSTLDVTTAINNSPPAERKIFLCGHFIINDKAGTEDGTDQDTRMCGRRSPPSMQFHVGTPKPPPPLSQSDEAPTVAQRGEAALKKGEAPEPKGGVAAPQKSEEAVAASQMPNFGNATFSTNALHVVKLTDQTDLVSRADMQHVGYGFVLTRGTHIVTLRESGKGINVRSKSALLDPGTAAKLADLHRGPAGVVVAADAFLDGTHLHIATLTRTSPDPVRPSTHDCYEVHVYQCPGNARPLGSFASNWYSAWHSVKYACARYVYDVGCHDAVFSRAFTAERRGACSSPTAASPESSEYDTTFFRSSIVIAAPTQDRPQPQLHWQDVLRLTINGKVLDCYGAPFGAPAPPR